MKKEFKFERGDPSYYVGDEVHRIKQEKIQDAMGRHGFDALLFLQSAAVRYVTDFFVKGYRSYTQNIEYLAVVPKGKEPILGYRSGSDEYRVKIRCITEDARKMGSPSAWPQFIAEILEDYGLTAGRIGVDILPFDTYLSLKKILPKLEIENANKLWSELTAEKHPTEIKYIRKALEIDEKGMEAAMDVIKDGIREFEVLAAAEYVFRKEGNEVMQGIMQVASGGNTAYFERIATDKVIKNGELVILDFVTLYRGYMGDIGRTVICGNPNKRQKEIFKVQINSLQRSIEAVKPGVKCSEIDAVARDAIIEAGYKDYMHKFATGHQLGYAHHGEPMIAANVEETLKPNMVVCLEPRVTLYDEWDVGGVTNEDVLLVTETGTEKLTHLKYDEKLFDC